MPGTIRILFHRGGVSVARSTALDSPLGLDAVEIEPPEAVMSETMDRD